MTRGAVVPEPSQRVSAYQPVTMKALPFSSSLCFDILRISSRNFIRTSICDKYSGSIKITSHLDHISHWKTASGTNWSNRWTYRVLITITRRDWIVRPSRSLSLSLFRARSISLSLSRAFALSLCRSLFLDRHAHCIAATPVFCSLATALELTVLGTRACEEC